MRWVIVAGPINHGEGRVLSDRPLHERGRWRTRGGELAFQDVKLVREVTPEDRQKGSHRRKRRSVVLMKGRELLKATIWR
jgi:hypothetical protein